MSDDYYEADSVEDDNLIHDKETAAAIKIQSAFRGHLTRKKLAHFQKHEIADYNKLVEAKKQRDIEKRYSHKIS